MCSVPSAKGFVRGARRIRKLAAYVLNLPVYWLTRISPRSPRRWVFGAWQGERYADNPRHLVEYVKKMDSSIECVWLATSRAALAEARATGVRAVHSYSARGYWLAATAGVAVVSGGQDDVNRYVCPPIVVNLWHGAPVVKKIGRASDLVQRRVDRQRLFNMLFPFHVGRVAQAYIAASGDEVLSLRAAFDAPEGSVFVTGFPRTDVLCATAASERRRGSVDILYAPTFRDLDPTLPIRLIRDHEELLANRLAELDAKLHVRLHPHTKVSPGSAGRGRILVSQGPYNRPDVNSILKDVDILLTDYSSIFVDFLLTGRPVVFAPFDLAAYVSTERELAAGYGSVEVTPGPICHDWREVLDVLALLVRGEDRWSSAREDGARVHHEFRDGNSSQRVYELVKRVSGCSE
ncbi:MAG: CDP-glycerol glycerophosphotransferase family protein [Micropruina sp.]